MSSKPREPWWPYVKNVLRSYPALRRQLNAVRQQQITTKYNSIGGGSEPGRTTEQTALRQLPPQRMRELEAVEAALNETARLPDGKLRNHIIRLVYFKKRYNLEGAAWACHVSYRTAQRYHGDFVRLVAGNLGIL